MPDLLLTQRDGAIVTITLNLPDLRNPISDVRMVDALVEAMEAADRDVTVRAVILTGAGKAFSSGGDLSKMGPGQGLRAELPMATARNYRDGIQRLPLLFDRLEVPVIAAVNGPAIGAGCDLACMCDIRIASTRAIFAESFVKLGLIPGDGGAWLLPRIVGWPRATELALTGRRVDAASALEYGLVTQVVEPDELMQAAGEAAAEIAHNPPRAVRATKRLLREAQAGASLAGLLALSANMQALAHETNDHEEAMSAFIEKRPAVFSGD